MPFAPATTKSTITAKFPSQLSWMMWGSFLQAHKAVVERIDKELKENGVLSLAQFEMVLRVRDVGGRIRFVDLATIMMVSPSRISRQIDALHSLGYLLREATNKDRRATFAVLTASGERAYQKSLGLFLHAFERHFLTHVPKRFAKPFVACLMALIDDTEHGEHHLPADRRACAPRSLGSEPSPRRLSGIKRRRLLSADGRHGDVPPPARRDG